MPATNASGLLDSRSLASAEALGMQARFVVEGYTAGEHKSPYHGFAIEFAQHREYSPGDDVRYVDWKVFGRSDRYYVKQYEQETNYIAHLLLDGSESMNYGSHEVTKLQYGKMLAACFAYLILGQRDAVSLSVFDDDVREHQPRSDNRAILHGLLNRLVKFQASRGTNVPAILHKLATETRRKGIIILISDLFDQEEETVRGLQHLRFGGHEVILFHLFDPYELEFPFNGMYEFEGLEATGKIMTKPHEIRKSYLEAIRSFEKRIREGCERNNCHYVQINTAQPLHEAIGKYLSFRLRTGK